MWLYCEDCGLIRESGFLRLRISREAVEPGTTERVAPAPDGPTTPQVDYDPQFGGPIAAVQRPFAMLEFQHGKSYWWLFPVQMLFVASGFVMCHALGDFRWGILTLPVFLALLLWSELRSRVALDSWWRATYSKGTWQYKATVAFQAICLALFLVLSYVLLR